MITISLKQRLREMAFLTKGLKISLKDTREGMEREKVFHYEGGIREFVSYLNRSKEGAYDRKSFTAKDSKTVCL